VFAKDVPDPENFGVVAYDGDGNVADIVEKAGVVDKRYDELEITDVNREYARRGQLVVQRVEGWWHDGGKHWGDLAEVGRLIEETGVNK
jgi:dTDP-glucose pyrophosphorylase